MAAETHMKYLIGNWKMNATVPEAVQLAGRIEDGIEDLNRGGRELPAVVLCPPYTALTAIGDVIDPRLLALGAQDIHWDESGPQTGEISAQMLEGLVEYVLVGHSERRMAGETEEQVQQKMVRAAEAGLTPVLCVGEDDPSEAAGQSVLAQLDSAFVEKSPAEFDRLIIAYEPVYAIGSDKPADPPHVDTVAATIHGWLEERGAGDAAVLYGGSITGENASLYTGITSIDGFLVGGTSLDPQGFITILDRMGRHE
jgi:triosephosphate isomerase